MDRVVCKGYKWSGVYAGIKGRRKKDLGLIFSENPASVAAVFTKNLVKAAPVVLTARRVVNGLCHAVVVNSGNANCCTGEAGMRDAERMTRIVADALGVDETFVLVASTGVIGVPLPVEVIERAVPNLVKKLSYGSLQDFAKSIMTTDRFAKVATVHEKMPGGEEFTICAVAKGAGMIRPDMATMLCFVCTDLKADAEFLSKALAVAVDKSFNAITVDGDTSTNDTVIIMANGAGKARISGDDEKKCFCRALDRTLMDLARLMVKDGEGATKLIDVRVRGACSAPDARLVADAVANSSLVKTAFFGEDANWGRIMAAIGRSGANIMPESTDIFFDEVQVVSNGLGCGLPAEEKAGLVLKRNEITLLIDLKTGGAGEARVLTCDLSTEYVKINSDYRS